MPRVVLNAVDDDILHHHALPELIEQDAEQGDDAAGPGLVLAGPGEDFIRVVGRWHVGVWWSAQAFGVRVGEGVV